MGSYCLLSNQKNVLESNSQSENPSLKCLCCKNTSSTGINPCIIFQKTSQKNLQPINPISNNQNPAISTTCPKNNNNNKDNQITKNNDQNIQALQINQKQYIPTTTDKLTEEDISELFEYYPPLNDGISVVLLPPMQSNDKTIYYGEWDTQNNFRHGRGIKIWQDNSNTKVTGFKIKLAEKEN